MAHARLATRALFANVTSVKLFTLWCPQCGKELRSVRQEEWRDLPSLLLCPACAAAVSLPSGPEGGKGTMSVWNRDKTLDLFQRQLYALQSEILGSLTFIDGKQRQAHTKYVYRVSVKGKTYTAVMEGYSHDYWLHRIDLHPLAKQIDLVICYRHNSCVRQRVLELCSPTGREYEEFAPPTWFDLETRGGNAWARVFVGALLAGYGPAYTELEKIREESPAAYYRYLQRKAELATHYWGRPMAV
jgi:predicted RNA-binding Zn-ribbon protein involved in translation (DUF1610 family)